VLRYWRCYGIADEREDPPEYRKTSRRQNAEIPGEAIPGMLTDMSNVVLGSGALIVLGLCLGASSMGQTVDSKSYAAELAKWQKEQTAELTADGGFLSVAGLFWLNEGENSIGSDPSCAIRLSATSSPKQLGTIKRLGGLVSLVLADGASVTLKDRSGSSTVEGSPAQSQINLKSERVSIGTATLSPSREDREKAFGSSTRTAKAIRNSRVKSGFLLTKTMFSRLSSYHTSRPRW